MPVVPSPPIDGLITARLAAFLADTMKWSMSGHWLASCQSRPPGLMIRAKDHHSHPLDHSQTASRRQSGLAKGAGEDPRGGFLDGHRTRPCHEFEIRPIIELELNFRIEFYDSCVIDENSALTNPSCCYCQLGGTQQYTPSSSRQSRRLQPPEARCALPRHLACAVRCLRVPIPISRSTRRHAGSKS